MRRWTLHFWHHLAAAIIAAELLLLILLHGIWSELPDVSDPAAFLARQSIVITDKDGGELFRFYEDEDRTVLPLSAIPQSVQDAFIAIEDKRFLSRNSCIDVRALLRAGLANVADYKSQGASTITQQLVRTALLNRGKTFERKIREVMLACQLEQQLNKEEILELYLNWIAFGHGIAGVQQASKRYFGIDVQDLSIAQSAVLASLPQRPSYYSPYGPHRRTTVSESLKQSIRNRTLDDVQSLPKEEIQPGLLGTDVRIGSKLERLPGRAESVLFAMHNEGSITTTQWDRAHRELQTLTFAPNQRTIRAPHFVLSLKQELDLLAEKNPQLLDQTGIRIQTTLDPKLQTIAEQTAAETSAWLQEEYGAEHLSILAVDRHTNAIRAYVGSPNFWNANGGQIDMIRIPRQPGSSFKPFIYAKLLEDGETTESRIYDTPLSTAVYWPFRSGYYGRMTLRTALARSRNIPAIRAYYRAGGEEPLLHFLDRIGVATPLWRKENERVHGRRFQYSWSLALGAAEASLLEVVQGFSTFARGGMLQPVTGITQIATQNGDALYTPRTQPRRVIQEATAHQITDILSDEKARETLWQSPMHLPFGTAAIKTGTSNTCLERDAFKRCRSILPNSTWTIGYTDDLIVGIWVGNVDNSPLIEDGAALHTALPVWKTFITQAHESSTPTTLALNP